MADPRATLSFNEIDENLATYAYDSTIVYDATKLGGSAQVGLAVTLTGNKTVGLIQDAQPITGKLISVESDGFCAVAFEGYVTLPAGNAATVTAGSKVVGALGAASARGYIRNAAVTVLAEAFAAKGEIQDATDTTNVVVRFM